MRTNNLGLPIKTASPDDLSAEMNTPPFDAKIPSEVDKKFLKYSGANTPTFYLRGSTLSANNPGKSSQSRSQKVGRVLQNEYSKIEMLSNIAV